MFSVNEKNEMYMMFTIFRGNILTSANGSIVEARGVSMIRLRVSRLMLTGALLAVMTLVSRPASPVADAIAASDSVAKRMPWPYP
jgi:hypothetical protein